MLFSIASQSQAAERWHIKCFNARGQTLAVKTLSPEGIAFDVNGIIDLPGQDEPQVEVQAHIKARPQGS